MAKQQKRSHGPYLIGAFFCEQILQENDGVTSVIRIVDKIISHVPISKESPIQVNLNLFISLKAGGCKKKIRLKVTPMTPSGEKWNPLGIDYDFSKGLELSIIGRSKVSFKMREQGLYWFDVVLGDKLITKLSLRCEGPPNRLPKKKR